MKFTISESELKSLLINPTPVSPTEWLANCPFCGKPKHFYIDKVKLLYHCKKCDVEGNQFGFLKQVKRLDLLQFGSSIDFKTRLENVIQLRFKSLSQDIQELPIVTMPTGCRRVYKNAYLDDRGFTAEDYNKYPIFQNTLNSQYKEYVFIAIEEKSTIKGYLARSIKSKQEIKALENRGIHVLRYRNSKDTDFGSLIGGYDEIKEGVTTTVIGVEGFFDKHNVDKILELDNRDDLKCIFTFGKKISQDQILKLLNKGVQNFILLYDGDAVEASKKYAFELNSYFNTLVGSVPSDKDPGSLTDVELFTILENLKTPTDYRGSIILKRSLIF